MRQECWDQALQCFGTAYIFEKRANDLRRKLQILTFLGIATPVLVGSIIASFGTDKPYIPYLLTITGIVSVVQITISVWSLVAKWDDNFAYSSKSNLANKELSSCFREFAQDPPQENSELELKYQIIKTEYRNRSEEDENQGLTDRERRMGMRAGLRQFRRDCATCGKTPTSMKPSKCDTCGNF